MRVSSIGLHVIIIVFVSVLLLGALGITNVCTNVRVYTAFFKPSSVQLLFFPRKVRTWNLLLFNVTLAANLQTFKSATMPALDPRTTF